MSMIGSNDKLKQAAAGAAGGEALNVEDVFSTYVYTGDASARSITNGIDLAGEGGLVWSKSRSSGVGVGDNYHQLYDTERGSDKYIFSNATNAEVTSSLLLTSFNSDGYSIGTRNGNNQSGQDYASWTFRKAPKFFDVQTWSGDGVAGREISHNLGSVPGCIMIKQTTGTNNWIVYHRGANGGTNPEQYNLYLNLTAAQEDFILFDDTAPAATNFTVGGYASVNGSGQTYVAYVFAHNNSDGEFGPDGDQDIIKCGSFSGYGTTVNLGWEPQWLLVKRSDSTGEWVLVDNMRGIATGGQDAVLYAHASDTETSANDWIDLTSTGFTCLLGSGDYIYIAIRRGTKVPESGTEVFNTDANGGTSSGNTGALTSGFPVDLAIFTQTTGANKEVISRINSTRLFTNLTNAENTPSRAADLDFMNGFGNGTYASDYVGWMWKRAPNFFDVVAYSGNGTNPHAVSHNLGVAPELIWIKSRDNARSWTSSIPTGSGISTTQRLMLNSTTGAVSQAYFPSQPTATEFSIISDPDINANGENYIAYLFASLAGVSKVGSYTGNGTTSNIIDCGFSAGARFVLIKRTDSTGDWLVFDTERGITSSGNDPYLELNSTNAEASYNILNANSSGFEIIQPWGDINYSGGSYIFYAIA